MDLLIRLEPETEGGLEREAARLGVSPSDAAARVLIERFVAPHRSSVRAIIDDIEREDATDDPTELTARQSEWDSLRAALDEDKFSDRPLFPTDCCVSSSSILARSVCSSCDTGLPTQTRVERGWTGSCPLGTG